MACHFFSARHGTARLHLSFCRAGLKIGTGPSTLPSLLRTLIFSMARLSVYTYAKAWTARLIWVPRPTYLVVLGKAKNLGTGAEPAPFTLSEFTVSCRKQRQCGTRTKILAVPCPKRYSVNGVYIYIQFKMFSYKQLRIDKVASRYLRLKSDQWNIFCMT